MCLSADMWFHRAESTWVHLQVGRQEPVMVVRVDKEKGYIDLSKRRVSPEDAEASEERFNKSKMASTASASVSSCCRCIHLSI